MKKTPYNLMAMLVTGLMVLSGAEVVLAAGDTGNNGGSGAQLFCTRDFGNFLANGIDLNGEGFNDYWLDILDIPGVGFSRYSNNFCRFNDIDSLLNRVDKSRKMLRQAFYVCDNKSAQKIKLEYYQLSAELYYLRHFVNTSNPPNPDASPAEKAQSVTKRGAIWKEFHDEFITGAQYFGETDGKDFFDKLEVKYLTKIDEYQNCSDPNLGDLKKKINDLINIFDTIKQMGKRFAARTDAVFSKTFDRIKANPGFIGGAVMGQSFGDNIGNLLDFRMNGENGFSATPWEELKGGLAANTPGVYTQPNTASGQPGAGATASPITINSIVGDLNTIAKRDDSANLDLQYLAEYDSKYRQTSGLGLDMVVVNMEDLAKTLQSSFDPLDRLRVCVNTVFGKQCN